MPSQSLVIKIEGDASGATAVLAGTTADIKSMKASLDEAGVAAQASGEATSYSMMEARHSVMLVGEELGVHVPRAVSSMIASIGPIGPLLAAAFPLLAAVALVEIIEKIVDHFNAAKEAAAKFAAEEEDVRVKGTLAADAIELQNLKLQDEIAKLEGGAGRNALREQLLETGDAAIKLASELAKDTEAQIKLFGDTSLFEKAKEDWLWFTQDAGNFTDSYQKVDAALQDTRDAVTRLDAARAEMDASPSKANQEAYAKAILDTQGALTRSIGTVRDYGTENGDNAAKIHAMAMEVAELGNAYKELGLTQQKAALDAKKTTDEQAKDAAEAAKKQEEEGKKAAEVWQKIQNEQRKAADGLKELAAAEQEFWGKARLDQYRELASETEKVTEADKKLATAAKELADEQTKTGLSATIAGYKLQEAQVKELMSTKSISAAEADAQLLELAQKEADAETAVLEKQLAERQAALDAAMQAVVAAESGTDQVVLADAEAAYDKEKLAYEKTQQEIVAIAQKTAAQKEAIESQNATRIANEELQVLNTVNRAVTSNLNNWIQGHETFGKAAMKTWISLEETAVKSLLKIAEQMIEGALLHKSIGESQKLDDAGTAAAGAWASAASIPVIGWVIAPIAAAAAFAGVLAFDEGGMVPETGVALLHDHEAVLTPQQTETLQKAADIGGLEAGGGDTHHHFHFHGFDGEDVQRTFMKNLPALGTAVQAATRAGHYDVNAALRGK